MIIYIQNLLIREMTKYLYECNRRAKNSCLAATHYKQLEVKGEIYYTPCLCVDECGEPGTYKDFEPSIRVIEIKES